MTRHDRNKGSITSAVQQPAEHAEPFGAAGGLAVMPLWLLEPASWQHPVAAWSLKWSELPRRERFASPLLQSLPFQPAMQKSAQCISKISPALMQHKG